MGQFTYNGPGERIYPDITVSGSVLVAQSGTTYDLSADPGDGLWSAVTQPAPQPPQSAPESPTSPATSED